jgi:phosphopantothenoylcysteine decarboxylase/phosphopantothenate--cysteine ligase
MERGAEVQVVMTRAACEFVQPLTFAALTGRKVITDMFAAENAGPANVESAIEHIAVAQRIDALVIAPATAGTIAKLAQGLADDFLSTLALATTAPLIVAPAMNVNMFEHAATRANIETLRARGVRIVAPDEGYLACGMVGAGRLAGVEAIAAEVFSTLGIKHDLERETVLVTAGPTCEDLDPVRYITNRSSGKMGYAIADAARRRGARVILVSGPTAMKAPDGVEFVQVRTADEMHRAVREHLADATVVIMAAAVADFRPAAAATQKIKRGAGKLSLELESTQDILAEVAAVNSKGKSRRVIVGFAAETNDVTGNARKKLNSKGADLIVANDVTEPGAGFDGDTNIVTLIFREAPENRETEVRLSQMSKFDVATRVLDEAHQIAARLRSAQATVKQ